MGSDLELPVIIRHFAGLVSDAGLWGSRLCCDLQSVPLDPAQKRRVQVLHILLCSTVDAQNKSRADDKTFHFTEATKAS